MHPFVLNGVLWRVVRVSKEDSRLIDRSGSYRLATTDPNTHCVYLLNTLKGEDLEVVLTHEIGHCAMISYNLLPSLHSIIPESSWVDVEEWLCNYLANYGKEVFHAVNTAFGLPLRKCG